MMKGVTLVAIAALAGSAAAGQMFHSVSSQGSVHNKTFGAINYTGSLTEAYDYGDFEYGGNTINSIAPVLAKSTLVVDKVNVFIVNSTSDGLGIFVVFDNGLADAANLTGESLPGTQANNATGTLSFSPAPIGDQTLLVEDDDETSLVEGSSVDPFDFTFNWVLGKTDGLVSTFASADQSFTLDLSLFQGVDGFALHGADGFLMEGDFSDLGGLASTTLGDYITVTAIPLPHAGALAGVGLLGVGIRRRR